jgi:predicted DNA binding CopG/RHH family protein
MLLLKVPSSFPGRERRKNRSIQSVDAFFVSARLSAADEGRPLSRMATSERRFLMVTKKSKIPQFRTDQEERQFWTQHSFEEFADELEELDVLIQPTRTEQIALRLRKEDVEALRAVAKAKGVGHTTLARSIVEQWVAHWRQRTRRARAPRSRRAA